MFKKSFDDALPTEQTKKKREKAVHRKFLSLIRYFTHFSSSFSTILPVLLNYLLSLCIYIVFIFVYFYSKYFVAENNVVPLGFVL